MQCNDNNKAKKKKRNKNKIYSFAHFFPFQTIRDKNPLDKPLILEAREELRQATSTTREVETLMADDLIDFEKRKLQDLK